MGKTNAAVLDDLNTFLEDLRTKQAAEAPLGGDQGDKDTTHPSKTVDNQEQGATEGSRSAENEADISSDVPGVNINDVSAEEANKEAKPVGQTTAATTGEDPSNETESVKFDKEDPGTSHPSEMNGTENGKNAGAKGDQKNPVDDLIAKHGLEKVATELADLVIEETGGEPTDQEKKAAAEAANAGAGAADDLVDRQINENLPQIFSNLDKSAAAMANDLAHFYIGIQHSAQEKQAEDGEEDDDTSEKPMPGETGGEGALPTDDLQQLAAAAGGEEAGVMPPAPAEAGIEMGVEGEPSDEEVVEALSEALADAGVTPEELVMAIEADQSAAPGVPMDAKMAALNTAREACQEINRYRNLNAAGRWKTQKRASLDLKWSMRRLINEVVGR